MSLSAKRKERKLIFEQSFVFDESRDDQKIIMWLFKVNTQIHINDRAIEDPLEKENKIMIAENHLNEISLRQYIIKIQQDDRFTIYDDFVNWIREFYVSSDLLDHYRQQYRRCRQQQDETVEAYYLRFIELIVKLDKPSELSWQVSDFVNGL